MGYREELKDILINCRDILVGEKFYIWGAGNTTDLNYDVIRKEKLIPIAFIDNVKTGKFYGVDIVSPSDIMDSNINTILISSAVPQRAQEICKQIKSIDKSIRYYNIDEIILGRHVEEILETYDLLTTESSKRTYYEIIKARIDGTVFPNISVFNDQYFHFPQFRIRNPKEIFVDCGAFVGDTVEQYLFVRSGVFNRIVAIEPDKRNIELLNRRVDRLRKEWCTEGMSIDVIQGSIGKNEEEVYINDSIESISTKISKSDQGNKVKMYTIDNLFKNTGIDFIKADIEGYEMDMLVGGAESIKAHHPILAICIYHKTSDLYEIPLYINRLNKKYKFEIAHHYYNFNETVLYAYE